MKAALKRGVKSVLTATGRTSVATRVLTYHSIGLRRHDMNVTLDNFERQMAWLAEHAEIIDLDYAISGRPGVAITFDDGFEDNLRNAAPVLQRHGFPATLFFVSGRCGGYLDDEPDPEHGRIMDWDQLRAWREQGLHVGGHTRSHPKLAQLDTAAQRGEIAGCKADIENALGEAVPHFAYPYGSAWDYTEQSVALAQEAGYAAAFSNRYGPCVPGDGPYQFRRIWIDATDTLPAFAAKVTGKLDSLRHLEGPAALALRRTLNRLTSR
ncbi:MAG: polysaccharide deacetylase family protein [Candidatus Hydrogenedens sp.]|nr:polysaccharide deacetylase family protein [Candidatus Hydrogenedens sp.]